MNILADENVPRLIVDQLRKEGHTVQYIFDIARGSVDIDILERANRENALLLTDDKDFGELVVYQQRQSSGVILMRLEGIPFMQRAEIIIRLIREYDTDLLDTFTVVTVRAVRLRRNPSNQ